VKLLLDTHILIWWLYDDPKLPRHHRDLIADGSNDIFVSVASCWEIEIKSSRGNLVIDPDYAEALTEEGFSILPISMGHILALRTLPLHHQDPFDRILMAQAIAEDLTLLSVDRHFKRYDDIKLL
jgi:PIN domain nuclease of toxin-antitoxin system